MFFLRGSGDFKKALRGLGLGVSDEFRKQLRKRIAGNSKVITLDLLRQFMGGSARIETESSADITATKNKLANIPNEVPDCKLSFQ